MTTASSTLVVVFETIDVCSRFLPLPDDRRLVFSYGEQVPAGEGQLSFWTSGEHAARLTRAGLAPAFAAPPQNWLSTLDPELVGRDVTTVPLANLPAGEGEMFIKPAGLKVPGLSAGLWDPGRFTDTAGDLGVPAQSMTQFSRTVLHLDLEHRFVVADGVVLTGSPYLMGGAVYHQGMTSPRFAEAQQFAQAAVTSLGDTCPPACSLDVAWDLERERWLIVEANALWSSGMYGCEPTAFTLAVELANTAGDGPWAWAPDAYQSQRASSLPLVAAVPADRATGWLNVQTG